MKRNPVSLCAGCCLLLACSGDGGGIPGGTTDVGAGGMGGDVTTGVGGENATTSTASGGGQGGSGGSAINDGFIGGPCVSDVDCDYDGAVCLTQQDGFPQGMCSLDCSKLCPDADGMVTTFCTTLAALGVTDPSLASEGLCTTRCDYGQSDTGCRQGYQCQRHSRYNEPETETYVCVPGEDAPFQLSACHQELLTSGVAFSPAVNPDHSPDGLPDVICTITDPVWVAGTIGGVAFRPSSPDNQPKAILSSCAQARAMVASVPVLSELDITDVIHYGVYNCRVIAGTKKLSQHGMANAIDIAGVKLAGGDYYSVLGDWEKGQPNPTTAAGKLLLSFVQTLHADHTYNIILTPEYNAAHADHFHCDLTPGAHSLK